MLLNQSVNNYVNIPELNVCKHEKVHKVNLVNLFNTAYWQELCNSPPFVCVIDENHWNYDDDIFKLYVHNISKIKCYISFGNVPFFNDADLFSDRLDVISRRIKIFNSVCNRKVSFPIIENKICVDLLVKHRNDFDYYNCSFVSLDKSQYAGILRSLKNVSDVFSKPIITEFQIPCSKFNGKNVSSEQKAIEEIDKIIYSVNTINNGNVWIFNGSFKDVCASPIRHRDFCEEKCFSGIVDKNNIIKQSIVNHIKYLSQAI